MTAQVTCPSRKPVLPLGDIPPAFRLLVASSATCHLGSLSHPLFNRSPSSTDCYLGTLQTHPFPPFPLQMFLTSSHSPAPPPSALQPTLLTAGVLATHMDKPWEVSRCSWWKATHENMDLQTWPFLSCFLSWHLQLMPHSPWLWVL